MNPSRTVLLCADTATEVESVAVVVDGEIWAERTVYRRRGHSSGILDDLDGALVDAQLDLDDVTGLVCGLGPGSFTGLRIALATLKGLALARGLPLFGVRTTEALRAAMPGPRTWAVVDARRGEVYAEGPGLSEPVCCAPEALAGLLEGAPPTALVGAGARKYAEVLKAAFPGALIPTEPGLHIPRAALMASLCGEAAPLGTLEPIYVRRSDAEINYPDGFPIATALKPRGQRGQRGHRG